MLASARGETRVSSVSIRREARLSTRDFLWLHPKQVSNLWPHARHVSWLTSEDAIYGHRRVHEQ